MHVLESRYDERRLSALSRSVQEALLSVLRIPPDDFFQIIYEASRQRLLHTPSFVGMNYSDDFILILARSRTCGPQARRVRSRRALCTILTPTTD
jgi:hypothetical protein